MENAIAFGGQEHGFYVEAKARRLLEIARRHLGSHSVSMLDVGCGIGLVDRLLLPHASAVEGVDVSSAMVERARETNPGTAYQVFDGRRLPFGDGEFDVVFAVCVLHHVEPSDRQHLLAEMARVTKDTGLTLVFEHNALNPGTRRVVRTCAFDERVELLGRRELVRLYRAAGLTVIDSEYLLFFPWRAHLFAQVERGLTKLPLGAQYVVAGRPHQPTQRQVTKSRVK